MSEDALAAAVCMCVCVHVTVCYCARDCERTEGYARDRTGVSTVCVVLRLAVGFRHL